MVFYETFDVLCTKEAITLKDDIFIFGYLLVYEITKLRNGSIRYAICSSKCLILRVLTYDQDITTFLTRE